MQIEDSIIKWLLEGDPAVRWQVQRDLLDLAPQIYQVERERTATEGWGARFLSLQDPGGTWGGGLYSPKWISTTYTLLTLRYLGLPPEHPQILRGCELLLENGFFPVDGGINFSSTSKYSETCITGMVLSLLAYFRYPDSRVHRIAEHLLDEQMTDNGWNCRSPYGATHSSFHTTISALEGLYEYEKAYPKNASAVREAQAKACEFLLVHRLYRSHRTGEIVNVRMTRFPFPPRWYYDVLRALDYFQVIGAERDERLMDAISLLQKKRRKDGCWPQYRGPSGETFFDMEKAGRAGRMNTLRVLRVFRWWFAE
jgi:hypothetical protein